MWLVDDLFFILLLEDLAFVDGRADDFIKELKRVHLDERGLWSSLGTKGAFYRSFAEAEVPRMTDELASIWAEVAFHAGYLTPERMVDETAWEEIVSQVKEQAASGDLTLDSIHEQHGEFSAIVGFTRAYISTGGKWVFLDFETPRNGSWLKSIRLPTPSFAEGVLFTPWGRRYASAAVGSS